MSFVTSALLGSTMILSAAPNGGVVTSGDAIISQNSNVTNIQQSSQKATINWQNFSIAKNETVNFKQPNINSITLNRVIGNERSIINGALNANGQVWILNSNGVLFGKNAKINTSGILATTSKLSDDDFNNGIYRFKDATNNSIINQGEIEIENNGSVILASNEIINEGKIKAIKGNVQLIGAKDYSINLSGNSLVNLRVDKGVLDAMVKNSGTILNNGGSIYLTTNAVDELLKGVVNNTGIIEANSIDDMKTDVELFAHGGTANVSGIINAKDGFVETSGKKVKIDDIFKVKANKWLIDPVDFTVAVSGGDISGATLSSNLASANVEIQSASGSSGTNGDIFINDTISWNTANKLTLNAYNDIFINKSITSSHVNGQLALYYGQKSNSGDSSTYHVRAKVNLKAGDNFFTKLGSGGSEKTWTVLTQLGNQGSTTTTDLQGMKGDLTKNYVLGADIDASSTASWHSNTGFNPVGGPFSAYFTGNLDGLGHTIDKFTINRTGYDNQGLFGQVASGSEIKNIGLTNTSIAGKSSVGALIGENRGTLINSYVSGTVSGTNRIGGLIGYQINGIITNSHASGTVTGNEYVGGLIGFHAGNLINSYVSGTVTGNLSVGALTGTIGTMTNSYYDNETNTDSSLFDIAYGKTKSEIISLVKANWDVEEDNSLEKGKLILAWQDSSKSYNKTWIVGTKGLVSNNTSRSQDEDVSNILTPIANQTVIKMDPIQTHFPRKLNIKSNIKASPVVVIPNKKTNKMVTLRELQQNSVGEVRVPIQDDSILTIVNSGVNLPSGLEQQFFVTSEEK